MDKSHHVKENIWFPFTKQWTQYWDAGRFLHLDLTTRMTAALVNCKLIIFQILLWNIYFAGRPLKFTIGGWQQKEMVGLLVALPGVDKTNKTWQTWLRRLWRCGAFSACQSDESTALFHHPARRHSPTLLCVFFKAWPTDPIRSSQEPKLHATVAILCSVSSAQLLSVCMKFPGRKTTWDVWLHMIPGSVNEEDVTTYQELLGIYLKKMIHRIKSALEVAWRRRCDVSRASRELLEEDVTMYQERLGSYLKKMLRCIKSVLEVAWRRCYDVSRASWKLLEEDVAT